MDPTYITIVINSTNATEVLSKAATLLYNTLGLLPILVLLAVTGIILVVMDIALRLSKGENHKNESQTQQQVDNRNISVDLKTLSAVKDSIFIGSILVLLVIIVTLITLAAPASIMLYQLSIFLILLVAVTSILILYDGYTRVRELLPKRIKRIIKKTIIYEDGTTEEREKKYEY